MAAVDWRAIRAAQLGEKREASPFQKISLPVLPKGLTDFLRLADDPNLAPSVLADSIQKDAALTCELLKHVNSAQFGLSRKASSAQQALALLGIRQTKLLLIAAGARLATASRQSRLINLNNFWKANFERALFAREVAVMLGADADLAFTAGMLQDFLLPALSNEQLPDYVQFLEGQTRQPIDLVQFEHKKFGWTHALAGASVMYDWGFPDDLVCCILFHHRGFELLADPALRNNSATAVAVSSMIPDSLLQVPGGLEKLVKLQNLWPNFDLERIANSVEEQFRNAGQGSLQNSSLKKRLEQSGLLAAAC